VRWPSRTFGSYLSHATTPDQNLALQDELYRLRSEAKDAFDEAKALGAKWTELQREQKEVYQVRPPDCASILKTLILTSAVHTSIPPHAPPTRHNGTR
jgi:hypothetical protein